MQDGVQENKDSDYIHASDNYALRPSILAAASNALINDRVQLKRIMDAEERNFQKQHAGHIRIENSETRVRTALHNLSYTRTYYCNAMLKELVRNGGIQFSEPRFGMKPMMPYTQGRHLLSLTTCKQGKWFDWKMDFQATFMEDAEHPNPVKKDPQQRAQFPVHGIHGGSEVAGPMVFEMLRQVQVRLAQYLEFVKYSNKKRQKQTPKSMENLTQSLTTVISTLSAAITSDIRAFHNDTTGALKLDWEGTRDPETVAPHAADHDADVTYNPRKRVVMRWHTAAGATIEVFNHFAMRRDHGFHMPMENSKTITFINKMIPVATNGWYDIVITTPTQECYKLNLTKWERPSTTHVTPFVILHKNSDILRHQGEFGVPDEHKHDFRDGEVGDYLTHKFPGYLIHGKGNEIDGMVHCLSTFMLLSNVTEANFRRAYEYVADLASGKRPLDDTGHPRDINDANDNWDFENDGNLLKFMRAYYSSDDSHAPNLSSVGDRSIFFFNVMGLVLGVEMSSPSLPPFVNYLKHSRAPHVPPRNPQQPQGQPLPPQEPQQPYQQPPAQPPQAQPPRAGGRGRGQRPRNVPQSQWAADPRRNHYTIIHDGSGYQVQDGYHKEVGPDGKTYVVPDGWVWFAPAMPYPPGPAGQANSKMPAPALPPTLKSAVQRLEAPTTDRRFIDAPESRLDCYDEEDYMLRQCFNPSSIAAPARLPLQPRKLSSERRRTFPVPLQTFAEWEPGAQGRQ